MILHAQALVVRYPGRAEPAVAGVDFTMAEGELVAVVGPNGSGKTTLLRALLGGLPVDAGRVTVEGRPVGNWPARELARLIAVVAQREEMLFPLDVRGTVMLGRYAHLGPVAAPGEADHHAVEESMRRADIGHLSHRRTDTLSGGEWQRVRIARALAQEPRLLVLDEPTASLDVRHEMEVLELARRLAYDGIATLLVTHQLNLAARYAGRMILMHEGRIAASGSPAEVLTAERVREVFGWPVAVTRWCDGSPQVVPLRPEEAAP